MFPANIYAILVSNLKDPGMRQELWQTRRTVNGQAAHNGPMDIGCQNSTNLTWLLNSADIGTRVCDSPLSSAITATWSTTTSGGKSLTMTLDNHKNDSSLQCTSIRNYFGIGAPFGYKRVLYLAQLSKLQVVAKVKNDSQTTACLTGSCAPSCFSDPARYNPNGHGWVNLVIGLPMYDETHGRNLWVELVLFDTPGWYNITNGATYNPQDANFVNNTYFYGNSASEEFYRIYITHAYVNDRTWLLPGQEHLYSIDFKSIVNTIRNTGGWKSNIDWSRVHVTDAYVGTELFGDAKSRWTVSEFDVLYEDAPINNSAPIGYFEGKSATTNCTVYGWTCDADKYSQPLEIQLYDGTNRITTSLPIIADKPFEAPQLCGNTTSHRFSYSFPAGDPIRNNQPHQIQARAGGIGILSDGSVIQTGFINLPLASGVTNTITCNSGYTSADLKTIINTYRGNLNSAYPILDNKVNMLDAAQVISYL
jgi:hypothetical protein